MSAVIHPEFVAAEFARAFGGRTPTLFAAPGRVNLIGEHTDYSGGLCLPGAIDRRCIAAIAASDRNDIRVRSANIDAEATLSTHDFVRAGDWSDYVGGVAAALRRAGHATPACELLVASDIPLGAGASSSAAIEVATALALLSLTATVVPRDLLVQLAREAEADFVGAPCGPMDQFASVNGRAGHALLLDCRTLTADAIPLPETAALLVFESGVRHRIADGGYAARRADCEAASAMLGASLRETTLRDIEGLPSRLHRRARHVVTENGRTLACAAALRAGDLTAAGVLMNASHESLSHDFDVTVPETDALAAIAREADGIFGARQMGGGFGGAVIALADAALADHAGASVADAYRARYGLGGAWFRCQLADGAGPAT